MYQILNVEFGTSRNSKSLTFIASNMVPGLGMSLFCYFSHLFFILAILFISTYYAQYFSVKFAQEFIA